MGERLDFFSKFRTVKQKENYYPFTLKNNYCKNLPPAFFFILWTLSELSTFGRLNDFKDSHAQNFRKTGVEFFFQMKLKIRVAL